MDKALAMWAHCQEWRKTVAGDGIDELYKRLDPFDVCVFRSSRSAVPIMLIIRV